MNSVIAPRRSLFRQFILRLTLPVLFAFALASLGTALITWQVQESKNLERQDNILSSFSEALTKPLWDCDNNTAQGIATAIGYLPRVSRVRVTEHCLQQALVAGDNQTIGRGYSSLSQPIEYLDEFGRKHNLGELEIIFQPASIASVLADNLWRYLVLLGVFMSMVIAAALLIFRRIISTPLQHFHQAIDNSKAANGSLTLLEKEMPRHNNELGDVMRAYDELMWQLDEVISELREKQAKLKSLARQDPLTGLGNRLVLEEALERGLARALRSGISSHVLLLDLNDFKPVNDTLGHAAGDYALQQVAMRLRHAVRANDTVVRLGGDEFVIIAEDLERFEDLRSLHNKILNLIAQPIDYQGQQILISASVGSAKFPEHGTTSSALLTHADRTMYKQKRNREIYRLTSVEQAT